MAVLPHPEVLALEWLPHDLIGRAPERERLRALLDDEIPPEARGPILVEGPPGCGSSTLARRGALDRADADRRLGGERGRVLSVRVRRCVGASGVAAELLRGFDEGFRERGFSVAEIMAGVLRRSNREHRALTVILDDVGPGCPDLARILRALDRPEQFLPEGTDRVLPLRTVVVGGPSALRAQIDSSGLTTKRALHISPLDGPTLFRIIFDRAERALGHPPVESEVREIVGQVEREGHGAARAVEILREHLGGAHGTLPVRGAPESIPRLALEPRIVEALAHACTSGAAPLSEVRGYEGLLAARCGERPLPATTFWRRILRLEQEGLIARDVRAGGPGGSKSTIRLLAGPERLARLMGDQGTHPAWAGNGAPPGPDGYRTPGGSSAPIAPSRGGELSSGAPGQGRLGSARPGRVI